MADTSLKVGASPLVRKTKTTTVTEEWDPVENQWVKKHRKVEEHEEPVDPLPFEPFPGGYRSPWTDRTPAPYRPYHPPLFPSVTWC